MEEFKKDDVLTLYDAFIKLCDFIECDVECGKCPLWKGRDIDCQDEKFGQSLKRIRESLGIKRK